MAAGLALVATMREDASCCSYPVDEGEASVRRGAVVRHLRPQRPRRRGFRGRAGAGAAVQGGARVEGRLLGPAQHVDAAKV